MKEAGLQYLKDEYDDYVKEKIAHTILEFQGGVTKSEGAQLKSNAKQEDVPSQVHAFLTHCLKKLEGCSSQRVGSKHLNHHVLHYVTCPSF